MTATAKTWARVGDTWTLESDDGLRRVAVELVSIAERDEHGFPDVGRFDLDVQLLMSAGWTTLWSQRGTRTCNAHLDWVIDQQLRMAARELPHDQPAEQRWAASRHSEPYCPICGGCDAHSPNCHWAR